MAARKILGLAERRARWARPLPRPPPRLGQWREEQGLSPSPSGPGPLRDLPDWSFTDGRPSPPWRGQLRRLRETQELLSRLQALTGSLEAAKLRGVGEGPPPTPPLRPKGSQYKPVRTSTDQHGPVRTSDSAPPPRRGSAHPSRPRPLPP